MDKYEALADAMKEMIDQVVRAKSAEKKNCGNKAKRRSEDTMIVRVIFNDPCTIVFWSDGTKTVVKCGNGDTFSKEVGIAMAICKYAYGNSGRYNNVINHWIEAGEDAKA